MHAIQDLRPVGYTQVQEESKISMPDRPAPVHGPSINTFLLVTTFTPVMHLTISMPLPASASIPQVPYFMHIYPHVPTSKHMSPKLYPQVAMLNGMPPATLVILPIPAM